MTRCLFVRGLGLRIDLQRNWTEPGLLDPVRWLWRLLVLALVSARTSLHPVRWRFVRGTRLQIDP